MSFPSTLPERRPSPITWWWRAAVLQRHVGAVADHLVRRLKEAGFGTSQVEGMKQGDWVLIDGGDVLIHVFRPEVREFYKLEKMWSADIPADQLAV